MSDIDVFNRQRQCEQDCNATYTALAKGLERLQGLGVIDVAQLVKALTAGGIACRECVDTCVPQTRHFDDDRKRDLVNISLELGGIAAVAVIAGAGAYLLFDAPVVGAIIMGCGAGFFGAQVSFTYLGRDPIDPNFSKVPVPSFPKLPAVRPVRNTRVTASVAGAVNAVLANQAQAIGLLNALITALNRSDGAAEAGDTSAEQRQLNAARDFAKKAAKAFSDALPLRLTLVSNWTGPGLDYSISERDALKLRNDIVINGFPRQFLDTLKKLGLDRKDQDIFIQRILANLVNRTSFRETSFRDILMDSALHAAELRAVSLLNQFSQSR